MMQTTMLVRSVIATRAVMSAAKRVAVLSAQMGHARGLSTSAGGAGSSASAASSPSAPASFIERVKAEGASAMLGVFLGNGVKFDRVLQGMRVTAISSGSVTCELDVKEGLQNSYTSLHGGAVATIVDVVGTMALLTMDPTRAGVSVDLSVSYLTAAKAGETITAVGTVLKTGKRLGFAQVELRHKDGSLVATGRHTKAL